MKVMRLTASGIEKARYRLRSSREKGPVHLFFRFADDSSHTDVSVIKCVHDFPPHEYTKASEREFREDYGYYVKDNRIYLRKGTVDGRTLLLCNPCSRLEPDGIKFGIAGASVVKVLAKDEEIDGKVIHRPIYVIDGEYVVMWKIGEDILKYCSFTGETTPYSESDLMSDAPHWQRVLISDAEMLMSSNCRGRNIRCRLLMKSP